MHAQHQSMPFQLPWLCSHGNKPAYNSDRDSHLACLNNCHLLQVATLRDPASARLGESLYTFLPRSVVGNLRDGVVMELDRLRARQLPFFCLQNRHGTDFRVQHYLASTVWPDSHGLSYEL